MLTAAAYSVGIDGSMIMDASRDEIGFWQAIVQTALEMQRARDKNLATMISNAVWSAVKSK